MKIAGVLIFVSGGLAFLGKRWAYALFVLLSLAYIPARTGFQLQWPHSEGVPSLALAAFSLNNYAHIVLFALFFLVTVMQFPVRGGSALAWSALATLVMGSICRTRGRRHTDGSLPPAGSRARHSGGCAGNGDRNGFPART